MARRTCLRAIFQTFRTLCAQTALENFDNIVWHMCMMRAIWVNAKQQFMKNKATTNHSFVVALGALFQLVHQLLASCNTYFTESV
jgi:hypothetical protein